MTQTPFSVAALRDALERMRASPQEEPLERALVDLARQGRRTDFNFLLRSSTDIPPDEWHALWTALRRRLGQEDRG